MTQGITQKLSFKVFTLVLAVTLLVPSAVKFSHIFSHHHHEICNGENQAHLHKADIDCNFYKFKLSSSYTLPNIGFVFVAIEENHSSYDTSYIFLSEYQKLHFSLRGPPQISLI